ncbi:MAG: glutathione S-transferase family protein [Alphaproteobacteria bacterium]
MAERTLVIGTKSWSSWSLRPWLALRQAGIPFDEVVIPLRRPDTATAIARFSPSGKVPVLIEGELRIWDSLAICEYAAELAPALWPADAAARAVARSVSAEMHAGFMELRRLMSMDVTARLPAPESTPTLRSDIARILELWGDCRARFEPSGPFLFGAFSVADAMYAPVVTRFVTYGVKLTQSARAYVEAMTALPAMRDWASASATA